VRFFGGGEGRGGKEKGTHGCHARNGALAVTALGSADERLALDDEVLGAVVANEELLHPAQAQKAAPKPEEGCEAENTAPNTAWGQTPTKTQQGAESRVSFKRYCRCRCCCRYLTTTTTMG